MASKVTKGEFLVAAPIYYALAIAAYFKERSQSLAYQRDVERDYTYRSEEGETELLEHAILFRQGAAWLTACGMLDPLPDMFGPTVYKIGDQFMEQWVKHSEDRSSPFYKYHTLEHPAGWLYPALENLNATYQQLSITEEDFDSGDTEWEPLPLDRDKDLSLQNAISSLDEVINQIRADNGYAATVPEERDFVLDSLGIASAKLKSAKTVCVPFLRQYIMEPLSLVLRRFQGAALSVAATAAKEAIVEFVKVNAGRLLELLLRSL